MREPRADRRRRALEGERAFGVGPIREKAHPLAQLLIESERHVVVPDARQNVLVLGGIALVRGPGNQAGGRRGCNPSRGNRIVCIANRMVPGLHCKLE